MGYSGKHIPTRAAPWAPAARHGSVSDRTGPGRIEPFRHGPQDQQQPNGGLAQAGFPL